MVTLDLKAKVMSINNKGCEILGYSREEIIGKDWFENFLPKKDRKKTKAAFEKIIQG